MSIRIVSVTVYTKWIFTGAESIGSMHVYKYGALEAIGANRPQSGFSHDQGCIEVTPYFETPKIPCDGEFEARSSHHSTFARAECDGKQPQIIISIAPQLMLRY